jgi:peroxiredoxin
MTQKKNPLVRAVVLLVVVLLASIIWFNRDRFSPIEVGARAPDYRVFSLRGDTVNLRDYRGSVTVLNLWQTTCGPCIKEMPTLEQLHKTLAPKGLNVIAVSTDLPKDSALIRQFGERLHLTFPLLHDRSGGMEKLYEIEGYPTTFIIDKQGRIREKFLAARDWTDPGLIAELQKLIGS